MKAPAPQRTQAARPHPSPSLQRADVLLEPLVLALHRRDPLHLRSRTHRCVGSGPLGNPKATQPGSQRVRRALRGTSGLWGRGA